ncbi:secretin N-terminal domain-containing protein [Methylobacterium sp. ARG-1]|uniref:secretin N-terminal domain-containing protein n=1 Tax=Methylobacterium sp. ARG-1 TaxID=1692501 RepID=UPI00067FBE8E|nr:secretin N-terminal domain-containing protein [Methylobacterium sp. ARG-1]
MPRPDRHGRPLTASAVVLGGALASGLGCAAAPLKLPDATYNYTVIDQDLAAALQEFGANLNIKVNVAPDVKGRIQGRIPEGKPQAFLDRLATAYNLEWYYDGSILYITPAKENRTQLLVLSPISYDTLKDALDALQISDPRFSLRPAPSKGLVMVSGPPRYVALVEQTLAGLVAEAQARPKSSPPALQAGKEPAPAKPTVLTVFRGSQTTILRDGRAERMPGPEPEMPARSGPQPAANWVRTEGPPVGVPGPGPTP